MENKTVRKTLKRTLLAIMTVSTLTALNVTLADGFAAAKRMPTQRLKSGEPKRSCCTPVNKDSIANALKFVHGNGLTANYTLRFTPSNTFKQQMQAYINYVHWMSGGAINHVTINWHMRDCGAGPNPGSCGGIINGNHFTEWQFGGNGNLSNNGGNFWPVGVMQVNRWYLIHTGTYLDNNQLNDQFISKKCANNDVYVKVSVQKSARGGGKLQFSDGKRIIKALPLKK